MTIQKIDTIIVGGGQGGLSTSYYLEQSGCPHLILEQGDQAAPVWRDGRWDSFTLVTPNWAVRLPGAEYSGPQPDGFMTKNEVIRYFQEYVSRFRLPLQCNKRAISVEQKTDRRGFLVSTDNEKFDADNVVIATGLFQRPKRQLIAQKIASGVTQIHSSQYRNPDALPPGAVLVVGSSQSGCQIADELHKSGRRVYLCVGGAGRIPRRYRGKDIYDWTRMAGLSDRIVDTLPSPKIKFSGNPHVSGKNGGQDINLHLFARDGIRLLGRLIDAQGDRIMLAPDLKQNLEKADKWESEYLKNIDAYIEKNGLPAPRQEMPQFRDGYEVPEIESLDLPREGINTLIWATGYEFDFNLVKLPIFDEDGYPIQKRGVTRIPGLYFIGLPWLYKQKSGLLNGVGDDAQYIVSMIAASKTFTAASETERPHVAEKHEPSSGLLDCR